MGRNLNKISALVRHHILTSTTAAGSGHPTSSLSATDLMVGLMFSGVFKFDVDSPQYLNNDRLIFSKGHASPLLYALWAAAGKVDEKELLTLRKFGSRLEGHPTLAFPYTEAATGSLGQGLSVGVGMAIAARLDNLPYRTYVLLGDSEMAEGSQWEAMQLAAHYKLDNFVGILDVNRLGQTGETMYGHNVAAYQQRIAAFGWETMVIDGHSLNEILSAYQRALKVKSKPVMIIAKTLKGKGVSFLEDKPGLHGVAVKPEKLNDALKELGEVDKTVRGEIAKPATIPKQEVGSRKYGSESADTYNLQPITHNLDKPVATRQAYGNALVRLFPQFPNMVVLDAETSNSTYAETFKKAHPERFLEMYIAEQNMVGTALGLSRRGKLPFVSTFAAFFTRAFDQIRMCQYSQANIKFCGSHAGVSIGQDGPSQMGLEDIALFRTVLGSVVLYPSDAISTEKLVQSAAQHNGMVYLRTNRAATPIVYSPEEEFRIGGCKVLKQSANDLITVVGAGVTLFEVLKAYEELLKNGIAIRVIDLYSVKPVDAATLRKAASETKAIITVEDHFAEGGIADAVREALSEHPVPVISLAVRKLPKSGKPEELLEFEEISAKAIIKKIREFLS